MVWFQFSFSQTGCQTNTKESSLSYYLAIAGGVTLTQTSFPAQFAALRLFSQIDSVPFRYTNFIIYEGESNVLHDFSNVRYNSAPAAVFA